MSEAFFSVGIPEATLMELERSLSPQQFRQAIYQVVKKSTDSLKAAISKEVRVSLGESGITRKFVDRAIVARIVPGDVPEGRVEVSGRPIPMIAFKPAVSLGNGVVLKGLAGMQPIVLKHAFKATVGKGQHVGIFLRAKQVNVSQQPLNRHGKPKYRYTPAGFAERLPIQEQFGPLPTVVAFPEILKKIEIDGQSLIAKNAQSQMDRFLKNQPQD